MSAPANQVGLRAIARVLFGIGVFGLAACDKPAGPDAAMIAGVPSNAAAINQSSIIDGVGGHVNPAAPIPGFPDLSQTCTAGGGSTVSGVAFDGTYIYVAHAGFVNSCITRYTAAGVYVDQKYFRPDSRGLTWVPGLGKLVTRSFSGSAGNQDNPAEMGRFFTIDYAAGTSALLTNYDVQPGNSQGQPGVDPDGTGYWTTNGTFLEHHRMSDGLLTAAWFAFQFFPATAPVSTTSNRVYVPYSANQYAVFDRTTGAAYPNVQTTNGNGCAGYGFGVRADNVLVGVDLNCATVRIETLDLVAHGPPSPYPASVYPGHVALCKNASSPPGIYMFTINATGTVAGDVVQSTAQLSPGQCRIIFLRTQASATVTTVSVTESPTVGQVVGSITRTEMGTTTTIPGPSPTATVQVNSANGGILTYTDVIAQIGIQAAAIAR